MSFTQEKGLNIGDNFKDQKMIFPHVTPVQKTIECDGCDKQCEIGTVSVCGYMYPTISGERLLYYKTADGEQHPFLGILEGTLGTPKLEKIKMLQFGQILTSLCDHYKTR